MKHAKPVKNLTASEMGKLGGQSRSPKKMAAILKNLKKANKTRRLTKRFA
jgi:hypothetical protein